MPLSKEKQAEYMRNLRLKQKLGITQEVVQPDPVIPNVIPKPDIVKLPWYAVNTNHFGDVLNKRYAKLFFDSL